MKRLPFPIIFTAYILLVSCSAMVCTSCRSIKNLSQKIDRIAKDSTAHKDSISVIKDSSKFNSEIVIDFGPAVSTSKFDTSIMAKLADGAEIDWNPFYSPEEFETVINKITTTQPIKRIVIKSNAQIHKIDSSVKHETVKTKTNEAKKEISKKVKRPPSPIWLLLLLIPVLYYLYKKYKSKWFTF